jgi:hypothetical protein
MENDKIKLIVAEAVQVPELGHDVKMDWAGAERHGKIPFVLRHATEITMDQISAEVNSTISKLSAAIAPVKKFAGEFELSEITIGLAVSGEGSIGIATAGVEATIELTFSREKKKAE